MVRTGRSLALRTSESAGVSSLVAPAIAALLTVVVIAAGWRGADWPAQVFRIEMFRSEGITVWNNHWYGGHHSLGYSVLMPPIGSVLGPSVVAVLSAVVATAAIESLLFRLRAGRSAVLVGSSLFAVGFVANVAVGRLAFMLGVAVALCALVCWARSRLGCAIALAALSGLASPVAALFLAIVAGGCSLVTWRSARDIVRFGDVRGQGPLLGLAAMGPVIVIAVVFPSGGTFPFALGGFLISLLALGATYVASDRSDRELHAVVLISLLATVGAIVMSTPVGGNVARLPMFFALPVITALTWCSRRWAVPVAAAVLLGWAWAAASDAVLWAAEDPTSDAAFFQPMIDAVLADAGGPARVEIPFTRRHWEAAYVAPELPLARGWERQLDRRVNPVFYDDDGLTALDLHVWLRDTAVQYVALPDAELDPSAKDEAELLDRGLPYLDLVWENDDWRVWRVLHSESLIEGPAELVDLTADGIVLDVRRAGEVTVRVRYSPHWTVEGPTCVREDLDDGWTILEVADAGRLEMTISPSALAGVSDATADGCDEPESDEPGTDDGS
ncbi:MAG: hypothetical protein JJE52_10435 [Acidimicrobiia bacterium]|nr:hypothetical protein [Acidimicrobiia bacterium]